MLQISLTEQRELFSDENDSAEDNGGAESLIRIVQINESETEVPKEWQI